MSTSIVDILKNSPLTSYKIAKDTGISEATIGNYRKGKTIPTMANAKILAEYFNNTPKDLSISDDIPTEEVPVAELPVLPAPLIDTPNISIWKEIQANQSQFEKINLLNLIRDVDVVYRVLSDMMTPNVAVGDLLFLKVLPNNIRVLNGECYFVDTRIFGGVVRYVFDEGDHYKLIAPNKAFADTEVAKEDVINIFQIRGRFSNRINRPDYMGNKQIKKQSQQITSLVDSVNNLVTATIDEGKRTDKVLEMLEREIEKNAKN